MIAFSLQTIIVSVFVIALSLNAPACVKAQPASSDPSRKVKAPAMSRREEMRVQEAADRFVKRFRKTLDFGSVFDETSVSNVVQRLRVQVTVGDESLGVEKGTKIYEVTKDIFTFFFIEENGQLKVLTLGMGN